MRLASAHNVFAVPHERGFIVYAPLANRIVWANASCVAQLKRYLETRDPSSVDAPLATRLGGLGWLDGRSVPVALPVDRHFHPTAVTLFLTTRCTLRCTYCYAAAGDMAPRTMPPEIYRAAIDLVARNGRRAGRAPALGFHGGGEPTAAWETLTGAVEYARRVCDCADGRRVNLGIATNGVMPPTHAEYVAITFPMVTLSFDGPAEIQNAGRPLPDGSGSFDNVMAFIEVLRSHKTPFTIRATVTELNVDKLVELVDFFVDRTGCQQLHFEPVFESGRRRRSAADGLAPEAFAASFVAALDRATARGVRLRYSAARLMGAYLSFCGCAQDAFNVTPDGDVTACFEVCEPSNPLAETFYFGRFDPAANAFAIDIDRLGRLRALNVHNKPLCDACFAKWTCSGDCPVKTSHTAVDFEAESPRCRMNQTITKALLVRALDSKTCRYV